MTICAKTIDHWNILCYNEIKNRKGESHMIENAASALVEMLLLNHIIEPEQVPAYQYGLEILISSIITCFTRSYAGFTWKPSGGAALFLDFCVTANHLWWISCTDILAVQSDLHLGDGAYIGILPDYAARVFY